MKIPFRPISFDAGAFPLINGIYIAPDTKDPDLHTRTTIECRDGTGNSWAICAFGQCFSKSKLNFVNESMPSSRSDKFIDDTRFSSSLEAFEFWENNWEEYVFKYPLFGQWKCVGGKWSRHPINKEQEKLVEKYNKSNNAHEGK